jgi:valyl-tRNA synthetase
MEHDTLLNSSTYDHQACEKKAQELWESHNVNAFQENSSAPIFSIDTPPPTVSGSLHIGHIFSYTHTDIIARKKRMDGFRVFYPMGFDDNGLATERFVEKKNKTKAHLMKRSEFIKLCLDESHAAEQDFEKLWRAMGLSIDWTKTYSTIAPNVRKVSQLSFIKLYNKGLIDYKEEPSLYCTTCQTAVAQAELDSHEVGTTFNDIAFTTQSGEKLTIATTRPELLVACVAVFYHPDDARYKHLAHQKAITPIYNKEVPLIADELVDMQKGSGLVMCCTFGDQTDIAWYKKHKLPFIAALDRDGKWASSSGSLAGLRAHEARKQILQELEQASALLAQKPIIHAVSIHERCKQEIEFLILKQWFVKILDHKEAFLKRAQELTWTPEFMHSRYRDWVENLKWDWCISRQRFYGIPFPVWHCNECSHVILAPEQSLPVDPQETAAPSTCPQCSSTNLRADTDVMDTWATSSLTPFINAGWPEKNSITLPMSMRPQAHDIIRTWAFYTIIMAHYHADSLPWNDIVISGHVLAGNAKISKSQGGAKLTPEALLEQYPADAIRYWTAKGRPGLDTAFSESELKGGLRLLTKMWNAFRFCKDFIAPHKSPYKGKFDDINKWLLSELSTTVANYQKHFEKFDYTHALGEVETFFWSTFCDNYLELVKDRLYKPEKYSAEELASTQHALYETGYALLQLLAPFIPHATETLYQLLFKENEKHTSLHNSTLQVTRYAYDYKASKDVAAIVLNIVNQVRKLKSTHALSLKTPLKSLTIYVANSAMSAQLKPLEVTLQAITQAEVISFKAEPLENPWLDGEEGSFVAYVEATHDKD